MRDTSTKNLPTKIGRIMKSDKQKMTKLEVPVLNEDLKFSSVILDCFQHFVFADSPLLVSSTRKLVFRSQLTAWTVQLQKSVKIGTFNEITNPQPVTHLKTRDPA